MCGEQLIMKMGKRRKALHAVVAQGLDVSTPLTPTTRFAEEEKGSMDQGTATNNTSRRMRKRIRRWIRRRIRRIIGRRIWRIIRRRMLKAQADLKMETFPKATADLKNIKIAEGPG